MSKINVDTLDKQSGSTVTVGGPGTNVILGTTGQTVTLGCGATQSGFGRTGTVNWCTTAKTSPLIGVSGNGYFVNTTGGVITVTLPASPSAGDIIALKDYANTWDTNKVTVARNGSKINGACACAVLNTESQSVTLIYVDGTKGWQDIHDSTSDVTGNPGFTTASGGTESTSPCGNFKIHTFNADGPLNITNVGTPAGGTNEVSYMFLAGGGSGAGGCGAGGGAGGFREGKVASDPYTDSPLDAGAGLVASIANFTVTVGGGGTGNPLAGPYSPGTNGGVSTFSSITSAGGGGGGGSPNASTGVDGNPGGSGGGGDPRNAGGVGNTPPVSPPQGQNGGRGNRNVSPSGQNAGGGGGSSGAIGGNGGPNGGCGGAGVTTSINASPVQRAAGGGGAWSNGSSGCNGGAGGGGKGGSPGSNATAGTANTGSGGGAGGIGSPASPVPSGAGGSGIVVVRYKFQ